MDLKKDETIQDVATVIAEEEDEITDDAATDESTEIVDITAEDTATEV